MAGNWKSTKSLCEEVAAGDAVFDAVLVLGGGAPSQPRVPPPYVANRCDAAAAVRAAHPEPAPAILCLSAGTVHKPQLISADGLPVWEATSSAAYLLDAGLPADSIFVETVAYDTIGNAFFARTTHTDLTGWRRLLVITSRFHMERTMAIFSWVFAAEPITEPYTLTYLATEDAGLPDSVLFARRAHEAQGTENVRTTLAPAYRTMRDIHSFLTSQHGMHSAAKLTERASSSGDEREPEAMAQSYGGQDSSL